MTPNKCYTAHRNVHEVGSRRDTQWQFFTEQKVENSDKQNHIKSRSGLPIPVLVAPGNVKRWPRLRPFEFAFCLSLNYSYQKYNSVSCTHTHMYTGGQWCNIKFIKYRRIQRFRKILITPAPECYVATVVVAFLPKFPWSLQASRCYQLLKNWNPAPKLEQLGSKTYRFIHKISTTISQHNWHEINENFTKFQGQRRKKKHENMQYEYHIFPTHSFTKAPNSLAFCQASRRTQKVGPLGPQLWMWEMYNTCLEIKWRLTKVDELFLGSLDDGCINVLLYCEALWYQTDHLVDRFAGWNYRCSQRWQGWPPVAPGLLATQQQLIPSLVKNMFGSKRTPRIQHVWVLVFFWMQLRILHFFLPCPYLWVPNTSTTPGAARLLQSFDIRKWCCMCFLQTSRLSGGLPTCVAPMIEGFIGCPHSNSKVSSTWDKLAVESLEFCQGRALAVFPNPYIYIYRHKANLIMQYLDFGSSPTRGDVLFSKQSRGVIGNHCAIWWYQRPISCFHRTADRGWDDLARPLWLA